MASGDEAMQDVGKLLVDVQRNLLRIRETLHNGSSGQNTSRGNTDLDALLRSLETDLQHKVEEPYPCVPAPRYPAFFICSFAARRRRRCSTPARSTA